MTAARETTAAAPLPSPAEELRAYCDAGVIVPADLAAARMLVGIARRVEPVEPSTFAWVAMCLALRAPRDGHTCVPLAATAEWAGTIDFDQADHLAWPLEPQAWIEALSTVAPLVVGPVTARRSSSMAKGATCGSISLDRWPRSGRSPRRSSAMGRGT